MHIQALGGIQETISALKAEAAGYRAKAVALHPEYSALKSRIAQLRARIRRLEQGEEDAPAFGIDPLPGTRRTLEATIEKMNQLGGQIAQYDQRAATIEGSVISMTLQAQSQAASEAAAARAAATKAAADAAAAAQAKAAAPAPAPVAASPTPVIVTAPVETVQPVAAPAPGAPPVADGRMRPQSVTTVPPGMPRQIPEAPLPVALPPIRRLAPAAATSLPADSVELEPAENGQNFLPLILAAGAVLFFVAKPKRKRRYAK